MPFPVQYLIRNNWNISKHSVFNDDHSPSAHTDKTRNLVKGAGKGPENVSEVEEVIFILISGTDRNLVSHYVPQ